jgi:hypothetical protein
VFQAEDGFPILFDGVAIGQATAIKPDWEAPGRIDW